VKLLKLVQHILRSKHVPSRTAFQQELKTNLCESSFNDHLVNSAIYIAVL